MLKKTIFIFCILSSSFSMALNQKFLKNPILLFKSIESKSMKKIIDLELKKYLFSIFTLYNTRADMTRNEKVIDYLKDIKRNLIKLNLYKKSRSFLLYKSKDLTVKIKYRLTENFKNNKILSISLKTKRNRSFVPRKYLKTIVGPHFDSDSLIVYYSKSRKYLLIFFGSGDTASAREHIFIFKRNKFFRVVKELPF